MPDKFGNVFTYFILFFTVIIDTSKQIIKLTLWV